MELFALSYSLFLDFFPLAVTVLVRSESIQIQKSYNAVALTFPSESNKIFKMFKGLLSADMSLYFPSMTYIIL